MSYFYRKIKQVVSGGTTTWTAKNLDVIDLSNVTTIKADITGDIVGNITGNVTGNIVGSITGDIEGDVTGNLEGDVTGNLTGNVTGHVVEGISTLTADGAIVLTTKVNMLAKTDAGAYTLVAASTANTGIELELIASTAKAHVVTGTGAFSGIGVTDGNDVATFGGAVGDGLRIISNGTTWVVVEPDTNITFSTDA